MKRCLVTIVIVIAAALMACSAFSCRRASEYETIATFHGVFGETTSDPFTITENGLIELTMIQEITQDGMDVKLYSTADDSQPYRHANWIATGDRFSDIPPGEYYLVTDLAQILLPPSLVNQGFNITIRDRTA